MTQNLSQSPKKKSASYKAFQKLATRIDEIVGSPFWFAFSVLMVIVWFFSGFRIGFGETWQLIINTTTTILTFLMISLLHSSQHKWEQKMERMQYREASKIKEIHKSTQNIEGSNIDNQNGNKQQNSNSKSSQ